jgi:hypothetical protein
MKITVIGAGTVGTTLARAWQRAGLDVTVALRDPSDERHAKLRTQLAVADVPTATAAADVVVLAVPGPAVADLVQENATTLDGRIVVDAANVMGDSGLHQLQTLAQALPNARLFRAFNSLGWENFADPFFLDEHGNRTAADLFFCGGSEDDDTGDGAARATVEQLITAVGLTPVWLGGTDQADVLDGVTRLWFTLALARGRGRHLAFKVLSRPTG